MGCSDCQALKGITLDMHQGTIMGLLGWELSSPKHPAAIGCMLKSHQRSNMGSKLGTFCAIGSKNLLTQKPWSHKFGTRWVTVSMLMEPEGHNGAGKSTTMSIMTGMRSIDNFRPVTDWFYPLSIPYSELLFEVAVLISSDVVFTCSFPAANLISSVLFEHACRSRVFSRDSNLEMFGVHCSLRRLSISHFERCQRWCARCFCFSWFPNRFKLDSRFFWQVFQLDQGLYPPSTGDAVVNGISVRGDSLGVRRQLGGTARPTPFGGDRMGNSFAHLDILWYLYIYLIYC